MFAYCGNNPISYKDEQGSRYCAATSVNEETAEERRVACSHQKKIANKSNSKKPSTTLSYVTDGIATWYSIVMLTCGGPLAFCFINNEINLIYYNFISSGESDLEQNGKSSYADAYISRWDRLDYTKEMTESSNYNPNAWRYQGEYAMHMYLWNMVKDSYGNGNFIIDRIGVSAKDAHIYVDAEDEDWRTRLITYFLGALGI